MRKYIRPEIKLIELETEHDIMNWYGSTIEPGGDWDWDWDRIYVIPGDDWDWLM